MIYEYNSNIVIMEGHAIILSLPTVLSILLGVLMCPKCKVYTS